MLLQAIAKHLRVLEQIPDFLPHLHVDADCCKEVGPANIRSKHLAGWLSWMPFILTRGLVDICVEGRVEQLPPGRNWRDRAGGATAAACSPPGPSR